MEWLGTVIGGKWGLMAAGVVAGWLAPRLKHWIVARISAEVGGKLKEVLDIKNPVDRALILAWVRWAEAKLPDEGLGADRKKLVTAFLRRLFPATLADVLSDSIEEAVKTMDIELKKAANG